MSNSAELISSRVKTLNMSFYMTEKRSGTAPLKLNHSYQLPADANNPTIMISSQLELDDKSFLSLSLEYDAIFRYAEEPSDIQSFVEDYCIKQATERGIQYFKEILSATGINIKHTEENEE